MEQKKKSIVASSAKMSVMTTVSRVFGLIRDQLQAHFLGTTMLSDAFSIGFLLPNLLRRLFAEGAMTASFIPVFTGVEHQRTKAESQQFLSSFFTLLTCIMVFVTVIGILIAPALVSIVYAGAAQSADKFDMTVALTRVMFPYIFCISLAAVVQGVLNMHGNFSIPAFTPVMLNLAIIGTVLAAHFIFPHAFPNLAFAFAAGTVAGGVLQLVMQIPFFLKTGYTLFPAFKWKDSELIRIAKLFAPGIIGVGIYQVNVLVSYGFAASLGDGRASALMFANRLNELTLGIFAVSLATVMLPTLSREALAKDTGQFRESLSYSLRLIALVTVPATAGILVLSDEIVSLLFKFGKFDMQSVKLVSGALITMSLALFFIASYRIIVQSFYSLKDTRTPVIVSAISFVLNALLSFLLTRIFKLDIMGIGLANAVGNTLMFLLMLSLLKRKMKEKHIVRMGGGLMRTILASAVMAGAAFGGKILLITPHIGKLALAWKLCVIIVIAIGVYLVCNYLFGNKDLAELVNAMKKKLRRG
ncbi:MAG: murein biosynthesis integral membrane protein MurJ [Spirochaetes bacterium]|nr:murein biosynthesis integral membrane protein MurJ [Spirochaetota bacterium]